MVHINESCYKYQGHFRPTYIIRNKIQPLSYQNWKCYIIWLDFKPQKSRLLPIIHDFSALMCLTNKWQMIFMVFCPNILKTCWKSGILSLILDYSYFKVEMLDFKPQKSNLSVKKSSSTDLRVPHIGVMNQFCHI